MDISFLTGFFVGLGFWPIVLTLTLCAALIICTETESSIAGVISLCAYFVIIYLLTDFNLLSYIYNHPTSIMMYMALYVVLGILYALFRWDRYTAKWYEDNTALVKGEDESKLKNAVPTTNRNKERIIAWMAYWPWSGLWWLLSDFVKEVWSFLYDRVYNLFVWVEKRHLQKNTQPKI